MSTPELNAFLRGAIVMACCVAGFLLLRLWRLSRDRLFVFFSVAFWVLAVHWTVIAVVDPHVETRHFAYVIRLVAFLLIIAGVVDKTRRG
jgi:uncharacterized protein DUF5985